MPVSGDGTARTGLGGAAGYGEIMVPRSDDGALRLDLSVIFQDGLNYFGVAYDARSVFVNTNGTLSFLSAFAAYPTAETAAVSRDLIAPFWGDVDTRLDGEGAESGAIWVDLDAATDTVTVTWDRVGVYRRDASRTNTVQLQLIDRGGGDFDIVFRYDHIGWILGSGIEDVGVLAGLASSRLIAPDWLFAAPGAAALAQLPQSIGNTGGTGLWLYEMRAGTVGAVQPVPGTIARGSEAGDLLQGTGLADHLTGLGGDDVLQGAGGDDSLDGGTGADRVRGEAGNDLIFGGDGADTLTGGDGNDTIAGGDSDADLRDVIYGGDGDDSIDGGYGNDELRGDNGNDTISGGFGTDTVIGGAGDDVLTGQAWSDLIFGGDGNDFINGGFGYDRVNGGAGADRFYHLGVADHGSDWVQDYTAADGDVLVFGGPASADQFQVNLTETANAGGAGVEEAFVIYRPTGQILWALVDGGAQAEINLVLNGGIYDLLI
ncbi:Hemolysin-type calcium-binding repeat-containing protein [Thalassovita gelatinovora]|uniref:calcium-binding protein n=1 Tax=Thalassovita gelatinovora TaxID=53501 RepID=UPI0008CC51E5|nr:nidogen-like domain-containing protein [Thalassovita gelatinovora]SER12160.1 Hemolysin-type calcium-binding repeat-containing protein [Thalassovita gelatinovora]